MKETERQLIPFEIRMICDCGGEMKPTGVVLTSSPPKYPHQCNKVECAKTMNFDRVYPLVDHRYAY